MRTASLVLLFGASAACDQQPQNDQAFVRYVASDYMKDCLSGLSQAPNEAMRHHLERLCKCAEKKILETPMSRTGDNDDTVSQKVRDASVACFNELGGGPYEKRN